MIDFISIHLFIGLVTSLYMTGNFCRVNYGGVFNFFISTPLVSWFGLFVLFSLNIIFWPVTLFIFLKYM